MPRQIPISRDRLELIASEFGTPFYMYDESGIRASISRLQSAFSWNLGFKEHFAVKACPNPYILSIVQEAGGGTDCSSGLELTLSRSAGITGENIMFSSNDTPIREFVQANNIGAIINLDDITHIPVLTDAIKGMSKVACFRYNPGLRRKVGEGFIGKPEEAKYGVTWEQLPDAYKTMRDLGVKRFGIHTMVVSNERNPDFFVGTAEMLFEQVQRLSRELGIEFEFVNLGGGIGIPYRPEQQEVDVNHVGEGVKAAHERMVVRRGLMPLGIRMENGRYVTGPHGWLVTRVRHVMKKHRNYVGVDACMADLMRPGMYSKPGDECYHHITVSGKEDSPHNTVADIVGSLCENNDKFAIQRKLPEVGIGDLLIIHDAGAHGRAMGFNYNAKLRTKELLYTRGRHTEKIRRAETESDYFATFNFPGSRFSDLAERN